MLYPQDLLKIYESLITQKKQARKLIERIARLQRLGPAETKAVLDLCSWGDDQFLQLLNVIEKYECYETEDVREKVKSTVHISQIKMSKGEALTMPNRLLVKLSKVNAEYFMKVADSIKEGKVSLRAAVEMFEKDKERLPVKVQIEEISGQKFENLKISYPDHFSTAVIDTFIGATDRNVKGKELKVYVSEVVAGGQAINKTVKVEEIKSYGEIVEESDVLIIRCDKSESEENFNKWLDEVCRKDLTTIILFNSENDQLHALLYLRETKGDELETQQLLFDKNPKELRQNEVVNLKFGLVSYQPERVQGKVKIYSGKLDNIRMVVSQLSKPGSKVSSISDTNLDILLVHSESLAGSVTYFGTKDQIMEVKHKISREGGTVSDGAIDEEKYDDGKSMDKDGSNAEKKSEETEGDNNVVQNDDENNTDNISEFETEQFSKKCYDCGVLFENQKVLDDHCTKMHSDYECIQCGEKFTTKESINTHKKERHNGRFQGLNKEVSDDSASLDSVSLLASSGGRKPDRSDKQLICSDSDSEDG